MSEASCLAGAWPLFPQHEAYLATRSVRLDVAEHSGVRSLIPKEVGRLLRWNSPAGCAGLLVPHCDERGAIVTARVRLDAPGAGPKFQLPSGSTVVPWIPNERVLVLCGLVCDALRDPCVPLIIVEGPVKAMALLGAGILAVGLGGVSAGGHDREAKEKRGMLRAHPMLRERITLHGRPVTILFDAGIVNNPSVADGAALNALALEAESVDLSLARLPLTDKGADQGPDDYLARHGIEALTQVLAGAAPATPTRRLKRIAQHVTAVREGATKEQRLTAMADALAPLLDDMTSAAILRRSGQAACEAFALEVQRVSGMSKRTVARAIESFEAKLRVRPSLQRREARETDSRPEIIVGTGVHEATSEAIRALRHASGLYCRGAALSELLFEERGIVGRAEPERVPVIRDVNTARLIDLLSEFARWKGQGNDGLKSVRPPDVIARAVEPRGNWPGVPRLDAVVSHPLLLADGRVLDQPGYDAGSALYLETAKGFPAVPLSPSQTEGQLATRRLLAVVADFPFQDESDRSAWISSLLTPLARHAFEGNAPLFATTGNTPGCGKGMLNEVTATIVAGRAMAIMAPVENRGSVATADRVDDNEMRKRITAHVRCATQLVLIDNAQVIGGNAINALLTCRGRWEDRLLGQSNVVSMPMTATWYATGNNLLLPRETRRRSVLIRLRSPLADPFRRTGFSQPNLIGWVHQTRQQLLHDALLILRAYIVAGRPSVGLDALGSFEEWSALVRNAVVWAGLPDPLDPLRSEVDLDPETETLRSLLMGLEVLTANGPVTSQRILEATSHPPDPVSHAPPNAALATAIGELVATSRPSAAQVSNALRPLVGRVLDGRKLAAKRTSAGWTWSVLRDGDAHDGNDGARQADPA